MRGVAIFAGKWVYLYRAVDSHGDTIDFMMSESRDEEAANYAGLANINLLLILAGFATMIEICQVKYFISRNIVLRQLSLSNHMLFQFLQSLLERSETL
jgi:hypothetical protein